MIKVINISIEPLEERYSIQWSKWFYDAFCTDEEIMVFSAVPFPSTSGKITTGSFLDVVETNMYKSLQTNEIIAHMVEQAINGYKVVLFFHDLWHPGLSSIAYVRDGLGLKNVKICGCLHAGSYDAFDFLHKQGMAPWARWLEDAWFGIIADKIFVATEFHRNLLCSRRLKVHPDKVVVTGFPMYPDFVPQPLPKEEIVVFPHRLDVEKKPDQFDTLAQELTQTFPDWRFVKTKEETKTKKEYYRLLSHSKVAVSCALQETWGIAMQEAVLCGCMPIVPDRLSYTEMYPEVFRYTTYLDLKDKVRYLMRHPKIHSLLQLQKEILRKGAEAIPNIIHEIKKLANE